MKKRLLSLFLALTMCLSLCVPVWATSSTYTQSPPQNLSADYESPLSRENQIKTILSAADINALYEEAQANMESGTPRSSINNISVACEASRKPAANHSVTTQGAATAQFDTGCAVRELGTIYDQSSGAKTGTVYAVAAVATESTYSSDTATEDRITTKLSLIWIDNLGINNELVSTNGLWEYESTKEIRDKQVVFGTYSNLLGFNDCVIRYPADNTMLFDYNAPRTITGYKFASEASLYSIGYGIVSLRVVTAIGD